MFQSGGLDFERLEAVDGTLDPIGASHLIRFRKRISATFQPESQLFFLKGELHISTLCLFEYVVQKLTIVVKKWEGPKTDFDHVET